MNSHRTPRSCASYQLSAAGNVGYGQWNNLRIAYWVEAFPSTMGSSIPSAASVAFTKSRRKRWNPRAISYRYLEPPPC